MLNTEVELILDRFEDLKSYNTEQFKQIHKKLDRVHSSCPNAIDMKSAIKFQWWNIGAIWTTVGALFVMLFKHVGK